MQAAISSLLANLAPTKASMYNSCIMGPSLNPTSHLSFPERIIILQLLENTKNEYFFLRGKTEYQALEEGRRQPRTEPRIVRYLKIISSRHNKPLSIC